MTKSDPVEPPSDAAERAEHTVSASDFEDEELKAALAQPETTKRELYSWYAYDWANSVIYNSVLSSFLGPYMVLIAGNNEGEDHLFEVVPGVSISSSTYYSSMVPISVILQLLLFIFAGTLGDYGGLRKKLLIISGLTGAVSTTLLVAVYDETYWLSGVCLIFLQVSLGFSLIQYNAYLPIIVANLPEVRKVRGTPEYEAVEEVTANRVSTRGFVFGYIAGVLLLLINVGISATTPTSCTQWCRDCPTELGNTTFPGWNAYEYKIDNGTMLLQKVYCSSNPDRPCFAWPGINPPCGAGVVDVDIVNETCMNTAGWQQYTYSNVGARWSFNTTTADPAALIAIANNATTLCTRKSLLLGDFVRAPTPADNSSQGLYVGLSADSGNEGCPHFRCSRSDCARGYDPSTCDPTHIGYRMNLMIAGLWWGLFGLITYFGVKVRPGPPMPKENIVKAGLKRTWVTIKKVRKLKHTFLFLAAFFFYGDGFSTIAFGAALVATDEPLFFTSLQLGILLLESNFTALLGNFFYLWLSNLMVAQWRKRKVAAGANPEDLDSYWVCRVIIFINLAFVCLMPLWGIPGAGLNSATEFYIAAAIFGFQTGAYQSFSRTLLSHLTPLGCESEFFSLYELTDKGSAWLGPVVFTVVKEATNNLRWGLFAIVFFFVVGGIFLFFVDAKEGGLQAADFHASAEVNIEDVVAGDPTVKVVEEPQSQREVAARVAKKQRAMSASRIELPTVAANDDDDEERVGGLLANEAPDPTTATPRIVEPAEDVPEAEVKPRRKTTRKGTRKNTSESSRKPRKETEGFSTRQLPLPELPEEAEEEEEDGEEEEEKKSE